MPKVGKNDVEVSEKKLQEQLVDPLQTVNVDPHIDDPDESDTVYDGIETAHLSAEQIQIRMDEQMMEDLT